VPGSGLGTVSSGVERVISRCVSRSRCVTARLLTKDSCCGTGTESGPTHRCVTARRSYSQSIDASEKVSGLVARASARPGHSPSLPGLAVYGQTDQGSAAVLESRER